MPSRFKIVAGELSAAEAFRAVARPDCGGVAIFLGTVRSPNEGRRIRKIDYQAHRPLAEAELERIGRDVRRRWPGARLYAAHRVGSLRPGQVSVICAAAAPHRAEAFAACRALIERLKKRLPVWKREFGQGGARWVRNRTS
jgi:molybdopterin synthase catalytic subunit